MKTTKFFLALIVHPKSAPECPSWYEIIKLIFVELCCDLDWFHVLNQWVDRVAMLGTPSTLGQWPHPGTVFMFTQCGLVCYQAFIFQRFRRVPVYSHSADHWLSHSLFLLWIVILRHLRMPWEKWLTVSRLKSCRFETKFLYHWGTGNKR